MKKETNKKKKTVRFIVQIILNLCFYGLVIFATVTIADKGYKFAYNVYGPVVVDEGEGKIKKFEVKRGASRYTIAENLYKEKLIVDKYSFYCRFMLDKSNIQPATYEISTRWTYEQIIAALSGKPIEEIEALVTRDDKRSEDNVITGYQEDEESLESKDKEDTKEKKESKDKEDAKEKKESKNDKEDKEKKTEKNK